MLKIKKNDKILIVRLSALGDCLHTIPLLVAIKKQYPSLFIGWAVSEKCKDVVLNNPIIDKVHIIPKKNNKKYFKTLNEIKKENYTISIDSQELLKSSVISFISGANHRLAHNKSREFSCLFANEKLPNIPLFDTSRHVIERNMDFARYLGIKQPEIDFILHKDNEKDVEYVKSLIEYVDIGKKTLIIAPSTTWKTKFWQKKYWASIIDKFAYKTNIILSGSPADKTYIDEIISLAKNKNVLNLTGKTNILQLKILFSFADIVLTPDSGSAHLAAAVNKPIVITLCTSTSPVRNGAWGEKNINLSANLSCSPCYKKICKYKNDNCVCSKQLLPDYVSQKITDVLQNE